jgi:acyl carrier protein
MNDGSYEQINLEVREMVKDKLNLGGELSEIQDDLIFGTSSGFDSTSLLEFILVLEHHFDIIIPDEDLIPGNFGSILQITNYIMKMKES